MINKTCECGAPFSYEPPKDYPDNRKYCDKCSAVKKAQWDAKESAKKNPQNIEFTGTSGASESPIAPVEKMQALNELGYVPKPMPKGVYESPKKASTSDEIRAAVAVKCAIELVNGGAILTDRITLQAVELYKLLKELANN